MKLKPENQNYYKTNPGNTRSQPAADPFLERSDGRGRDRSRDPFDEDMTRDRTRSLAADLITAEPVIEEEHDQTPLDAAEAVPAPAPGKAVSVAPLFTPEEAEDLQARWNEIQVAFVDEPRAAVERANNLVAETTKRLADSFANGRQRLEREWDQDGDASTETLRLAFQHYRSFFNRLLAI
jgi:hypothetical protein